MQYITIIDIHDFFSVGVVLTYEYFGHYTWNVIVMLNHMCCLYVRVCKNCKKESVLFRGRCM